MWADADSKSLAKAVAHHQMCRMEMGMSSLAKYAFIRISSHTAEHRGRQHFRRTASKRLLRTLRTLVTQRNAYSDAWRWARSASIVFGTLARAKQLNASQIGRVQRLRQANALYSTSVLHRAFSRFYAHAQQTLDQAVRLRMADLFHRRYRMMMVVYRLVMVLARRKCRRCHCKAVVAQQATAHYLRGWFRHLRSYVEKQRLRRRVRIRSHASSLQSVFQRWQRLAKDRKAIAATVVGALERRHKMGATRALIHWQTTAAFRLQIQNAQRENLLFWRRKMGARFLRALMGFAGKQRAVHDSTVAAQRHWLVSELHLFFHKLHEHCAFQHHGRVIHDRGEALRRSQQLRQGFSRLQKLCSLRQTQRATLQAVAEATDAARCEAGLQRYVERWRKRTRRFLRHKDLELQSHAFRAAWLLNKYMYRMKIWVWQSKKHSHSVRKAVGFRVERFNQVLVQQLLVNSDKRRMSYIGLLKSTRLWKYRRLVQGVKHLQAFVRARKLHIQLKVRAARNRRNALLKDGMRKLLRDESRCARHSTPAPRRRSNVADYALKHKLFHAWKQACHSRRHAHHFCTGESNAIKVNNGYDYAAGVIPFIPPPVGGLGLIPPGDPLAKEPPRTASWLEGPIVQPSTFTTRIAPPIASETVPPPVSDSVTSKLTAFPPLALPPASMTTFTQPADPKVSAEQQAEKELRMELAAAILQFVSEVRSQLEHNDQQDTVSAAFA